MGSMIPLIYWTGVAVVFLWYLVKLCFASNRAAFKASAERNGLTHSNRLMVATFGIIALLWPGA